MGINTCMFLVVFGLLDTYHSFLPFECESCHHKFCKLRFEQEEHRCVKLAAENAESKEQELAKIARNKKSKVNRPIYKCHRRKCKKREWIKIECNRCHHTYCLKHRSPDDHVCKPRVMQSAASCSKQAM